MPSRAHIVAFVLSLSLFWGCAHHPKANVPVVNHVVSPFQHYTAKNFDWPSIQRVVLMIPGNQTPYPRVGTELHRNLAAEFQRAGRFDVVVATHDDPGARAQDVFASGQFNEMEVLRVAREYQADAVLFVNVTQYHPYVPPRIGLSLLLVSPVEGIAIASSSGLWDAREANTSMLAQAYFKQTQNWPKSLMGTERVVESPDVFQRFVCQQVVSSFQSVDGGAGGPNTIMMPPAGMMPADCPPPGDAELPPMPPSSMEIPR